MLALLLAFAAMAMSSPSSAVDAKMAVRALEARYHHATTLKATFFEALFRRQRRRLGRIRHGVLFAPRTYALADELPEYKLFIVDGTNVWFYVPADRTASRAKVKDSSDRRGRRGRRRPDWDSLTPAEHTIATLVAEGLSNPQIGQRLYISGRTVQTHLAHVFAKLDITARAQLAAEVSRTSNIKPADAAGSAGE